MALAGLHIRVEDKTTEDNDGVTEHDQRVYVVDANGELVGELLYVSSATLGVEAGKGYPSLHLELIVGPDSLSEFVVDRAYVDRP